MTNHPPSKPMKSVGVPTEVKAYEGRVAMTPDGVRELERAGIDVLVQAGAGVNSSISDAEYVAAGATGLLRFSRRSSTRRIAIAIARR